MFQLKGYQTRAVEAMRSFLTQCHDTDTVAQAYQAVLTEQKDRVNYNLGFLEVTEQYLIRWLDKELRQSDVLQQQLTAFIAKVIKNLLQQKRLTVTVLVRNKFALAQATHDLIQFNTTACKHKRGAINKPCLPMITVPVFHPSFIIVFSLIIILLGVCRTYPFVARESPILDSSSGFARRIASYLTRKAEKMTKLGFSAVEQW